MCSLEITDSVIQQLKTASWNERQKHVRWRMQINYNSYLTVYAAGEVITVSGPRQITVNGICNVRWVTFVWVCLNVANNVLQNVAAVCWKCQRLSRKISFFFILVCNRLLNLICLSAIITTCAHLIHRDVHSSDPDIPRLYDIGASTGL